MIILLVLMVVAFYFLIMRPQRKRQQQQQNMIKTLEPGARVMTTTGIYGTIIANGERQLVLEISPGSRITVVKQAIAKVVKDDEEDAELRPYQADMPRVPDDLSGLSDAQTSEAAGYEGGDAGQTAADEAAGTTSGMAGGAPIQEYTPGNSPDFEEPEHTTSPWPTAGYTPEAEDTGEARTGNPDHYGNSPDSSGAGSSGGGSSVLGSSSLAPGKDATRGRSGDHSS